MGKKEILNELDPIFHPKSLALIGASDKQGKLGRMFMDRFLDTGFQTLYPVNPSANEVLGLKAYPSVKDIPGPVDLAFVVLPPRAVLDTVRDCVSKGVKGIIINSAGFGEMGEQGKEVEKEMVRIAREGGTRIIGPNCIGIYCPSSKLTFPMGPGKESGSVGVVSQSGSLADHLTLIATHNGVKFSKAISCGNECDLNALDFFEYLGNDPETEIIASYLEGIKDGRKFNELIREISKNKPMIIWKCGASEAGARAAASHTGALAGAASVWEGVLKGAGVVRVNSLEEMLDTLYAFYFQPLPVGRRVGIVSGPGGPAVGTTDACLSMGLEVPRLSEETKEKVRKIIPPAGTSCENPIDLSLASIVDKSIFSEVIRTVGCEDNIDMLLIIGIGGKEFHEIIAETTRDMNKPLAVSFIMPLETVVEDSKMYIESGIPLYSDPRRAAKALAKMAHYSEFRREMIGG
jgi:acyl-CoA synthetase (NDP forming)